MAYYDALIAKWATLSPDTTANKLIAINALTVAGPSRDVPIASVTAYLGMNGLMTVIEDWLATGPTPGLSRTAGKELMRVANSPHITTFAMSDPGTYASIQAMLNALVSAGVLSNGNVTALLAMAATTVPWWQSAGYRSAITANDLAMAGGLT